MSCSRVTLISLVLPVLLAGGVLCRNRFRINAWIWHLRHDAIVVGDYAIPVPANWCVESLQNGDQFLTRFDDDGTPIKQQTHACLRFHRAPRRFSEQDVEEAISLDVAFLEKQGLSPILRGAGTADGETITCVGGDKMSNTGEDDAEPLSWHCLASSGLEISITTTEPDMNQTWEIISNIRKNP